MTGGRERIVKLLVGIMSSHHIQSHSDPNYLIRLQNLRIGGGGGSGHGGDESPNRRTHSLNGSIDATSKDGNGYNHLTHAGLSNAAEYKIYERNNILPATKLNNSNAKLAQNFVAPQTSLAKGYLSGGYIINNSPTHSLSGSSQHSNSPRTSLNAAIGNSNHLLYDPKLVTVPVYENIDYYGTTTGSIDGVGAVAAASQAGPQQPHHHLHLHQHVNQPHTLYGVTQYASAGNIGGSGSNGSSSFDSTYKRAEPQSKYLTDPRRVSYLSYLSSCANNYFIMSFSQTNQYQQMQLDDLPIRHSHQMLLLNRRQYMKMFYR